MIKTSIIVPVYNTEEYLWECFESIFNQTQKEIEVIAINDGSTDNSLQVLEEIKRKYPPLIVVSQENKGLGSTRNKGIELARGEYIYFIDSDDCLKETAMETCYTYASENRLDFLMFDSEIFGDIFGKKNFYNREKIIEDKEKVLSGADFSNKYWLKTFCPSACLIYLSAKFIKENNLYFMSKVWYEDEEYHCKIMSMAKRIMYIPDALYMRRYRENSITSSQYKVEDFLCIIKAVSCIPREKSMEEIMHTMEINKLVGLLNKCKANQVSLKGQFGREFLETALAICGSNVNNIKSFQDLNVIYRICCDLDDNMISHDYKEKIRIKRKEMICEMFSNIFLSKADYYIGIYGTGKDTERFLYEYQNNVGKIQANLIFIDSYVKTGTIKFDKYDIYNIDDIQNLPIKCVVISSSKYEEEMYDLITRKYGNRFRIIRLKKDLKF